MSESESQSGIVLELAEEFLARYRRGERPPLREYIGRHPELAAEIREVFPAMAMMEKIALADESLDEPSTRSSGHGQARHTLQQLGDYRIIREIGHGGMGLVYEAEQVSLGRHVALKVLPDKALRDPKHKRRFEREARAAAKLHHTNIVPVFGVGEHDGLPYYVMQFIQGMGLDAVLDELRRMRPGAAHTPSGLPTAGEIRVTRRDVSAAEVARSLMTGTFQQESSEGAGLAPDRRPAMSCTVDEVAGSEKQVPGHEASAEYSGLARHRLSATTPTAPSADSATMSSSSITLPRPVGTGSRAAAKKHSYWQSVAHIGRQVADALEYAHRQGVLHRDIKPSNLLLDLRGTVWVTDFGLAKVSGPGSDGDNLTHTGDVLGTLRYMPPEAFDGKSDARADVYSLGLTLYEMLTLRPAYEEKDRHKLIKQVAMGEPAALDRVNPQIPRDLVTILHKAIAREPSRRYATAEEFSADLQRFLDDEPIQARRQTQLERYVRWARHNPGIAVLGAVLTAVLALATIASLVVAGYMMQAAAKERAARLQASQERAEANHQRDAAQLARKAEQRTAAQAKADRDLAQRDNYRSTIKLAESMLQGDDEAKYHVTDILWGAQPELRGWEWGYLMARCPLEQWSLDTHQGGLDMLAASADGRFLATAGIDGTVALWDSWTRKQLWWQKAGLVHSLALDSEDRYVGLSSTSESQSSIRILDLRSGRLLHQAPTSDLASVAFSPSGRDFYVRWSNKLERLRSQNGVAFAPVAIATLTPPPLEVEHRLGRKVFVDAAGVYVGVHDWTNVHRQSFLFDAQTLRPVTEMDSILPTGAMHVYSDCTPVLHSGLGSIVYAEGPSVFEDRLDWRARKSTGSRGLFTLPLAVAYLAYDPRSQTVIAAGGDGTVMYFDRAGKTRPLWHGSPMSGLALLPDGRVVTAGTDGLLKCWELAGAVKLAANTSRATDSASATFLAYAGENLLYQNWVRRMHFLFAPDPTSKVVFRRPEPGNYGEWFPVIRPHTNELVVDSPSALSFYSLPSGEQKSVKYRSLAVSKPESAAFDASGRLLVVSKKDGTLAVFDLDSDRQLPVPQARGRGAVAMNRAGTRAALLTTTGLQVWDVSSGRLLQRVDYDPGAGPLVTISNEIVAAPVFHPDGAVIAFVEGRGNGMNLILFDTATGKRRALIQGESGITFAMGAKYQTSCVFSKDGSRIFVPCSDAKIRIWDWRLGKELLALSDLKQTTNVAASPDGVTIAYAGWAPSLRIARALPFSGNTRRDTDFYRALDDFRIYTAQWPGTATDEADEAEMLGDIHRRRGEAKAARLDYTKAIETWQRQVLATPGDDRSQQRLAVLYEKCVGAALAVQATDGTAALQDEVHFWQQVPAIPPRKPTPATTPGLAREESASTAQQCLLHATLQLADYRLAENHKDVIESLADLLQPWAARAHKEPENHFVSAGLRALLARLLWASRVHQDSRALNSLLSTYPALAPTIGDLYAADNDWKTALAMYTKGLTAKATNPEWLGKRARAYEQLQNWDAAAADWARAAAVDPQGAKLLVGFAQRLAAGGHARLAGATRAKAIALFGEKKVKAAEGSPLAAELDDLLAKLEATVQEENTWAEIEPQIQKCLSLVDKLGPDHPAALTAMNRLGVVCWRMKQFDRAIPLFEKMVKIQEAKLGRNDLETLISIANLGVNYKDAGRVKEAIPLLEEAVRGAKKGSILAWVPNALFDALMRVDDATAAKHLDAIIPTLRTHFGENDAMTLAAMTNLGYYLARSRQFARAEVLLKDTIEREVRTLHEGDMLLLQTRTNLGELYQLQGRLAEAEKLLRQCLEERAKKEPNSFRLASTQSMLGRVLAQEKKFAEAESLLLAGYKGLKANASSTPVWGKYYLPDTLDWLAQLDEARGKRKEAKQWRTERAKYTEGAPRTPDKK